VKEINQLGSNHFVRDEVILTTIKRFNGFIKKLYGYCRYDPLAVQIQQDETKKITSQ
jgi:hypothetical protein